jgi:hypothetical protein
MADQSSILAVDPALLDELWRRRALIKVMRAFPGGRLAALCQALRDAGADDGGPLAEGARDVSTTVARATFEALCETIAAGVWDVPGWALRPHVDITGVLTRGRTPYPPGFEPDGFSTPELYVWLDGAADPDSVELARQRVEAAASRDEMRGEHPELARDVCEELEALLAHARLAGLLVLIAHAHAL